jgi:hypothetical protein
MKYLISLLFMLPISVSAREVYSININKFCADFVGIPYASDNFSDGEWEEFKECIELLKIYEVD